MYTVTLDVEDSNIDIVLNIVQNLKENIIAKCEIVSDKNDTQEFMILSQNALEKIWDNEEDSVYDKFLEV